MCNVSKFSGTGMGFYRLYCKMIYRWWYNGDNESVIIVGKGQ